MEHVKRLVLMPEHMAENTTQSKPLVPPLTSQVNHLDSKMDSLLQRQDITQDEKARLYSQILQCYLNYYKGMSQPVRVRVVSSKPTTEKLETQPEPVDLLDNIETDILESAPPTMKTRARQLVKKLKENKDLITWDDKAQLVYEGKPIPGSNVVDLVNEALRHKKILILMVGDFLQKH